MRDTESRIDKKKSHSFHMMATICTINFSSSSQLCMCFFIYVSVRSFFLLLFVACTHQKERRNVLDSFKQSLLLFMFFFCKQNSKNAENCSISSAFEYNLILRLQLIWNYAISNVKYADTIKCSSLVFDFSLYSHSRWARLDFPYVYSKNEWINR